MIFPGPVRNYGLEVARQRPRPPTLRQGCTCWVPTGDHSTLKLKLSLHDDPKTVGCTADFRILYALLSQWEFPPWEIRVALPKESQLQQSRATQP